MPDWMWSKADERGIARFVNPDAAMEAWRLDPRVDPLAEEQKPGGRRTIARAVYNALRDRNPSITYDREKYLHRGEYCQNVRTPRQILETEGRGTCLDLALLFCGYCLEFGLLPLLVMVEGHAFAAVSLTHGRKTTGP
jgi:hypothetical protein